MPYVTNEGAKLYWEQYGSGPPVLMIMGLSFTLDMWFRILPPLSPGYRAVVFDNRGVGRSEIPKGPYRMAQMARDALAVLDAAGVRRAHVVGASMGGMIAQELAFIAPERVASLVLGCTSHSGLFGKWPKFGCIRMQIRRSGAERQRRMSMLPLLYAASTPAHLIHEDIAVTCRCPSSFKGSLNQLCGVLLWSSYARLPKIQVPTAVVHGDEDRLVPIRNGQVLAERIPGAEFYSVRNAGHMLMTDQPQACRDILFNFLERQHGSAAWG